MRRPPLLLAAPWLAVAALAAPAARGQDTDAETWARLLVDHPATAAGDRDKIVGSWLGLLQSEPDHPLAEGTLRLVEAALDELDDPTAMAVQIVALPPDGLSPLARRERERLLALIALRRAPPAELESAQLFPDQLSHFAVLGPLAPFDDPLAFREPAPEYTDPGFGAAHAGPDGEVRWLPVLRSALRPFVRPSAALEPAHGWALLAARFDAPDGGPAWIEIDISSTADTGSSSGDARSRGPSSYAFSLNGESPMIVDMFGRESSPVVRQPVLLRAGRNRLVLKTNLDARTAFAVRVLAPDGSPLPALREADDDQPLGSAVAGAPPRDAPLDTAGWLAAQAGNGPSAQALAGLLAVIDGREAEGLGTLRAAVAAAPGRPGLTALLARLTSRARYLPDTWKKNHVRALYEQVWAAAPERLDAGLYLAGVLADEDQEEDAIGRLKQLSTLHERQSASLLELVRVYERLEMHAQSEDALAEAQRRTPNNPDVLNRLAQLQERHGQASRAADLSLAALRAGGATGRTLQTLARRFGDLGQLDRADALFRESLLRDDGTAGQLTWGRWLQGMDRLDEAEAVFTDLEQRFPHWEVPCLERADDARMAGDGAREVAALREALERRPSLRATRDRLFAATREDDTESLFKTWGADMDAVRRNFDDQGSKDSVVKVLDHAVVQVFPDGATETLSQDIYQVRDLQACEQLGHMRLSGEVLQVATVKKDGTVFEPLGPGNYVMPDLKPGDFVVTATREFRAAPASHVVRPGSWSFQSLEQPFHISRYVVSVPKSLPLRLETRHYTGPHELVDAGDRTVHAFEMDEQPRVLPEPKAPPPSWFLPWVEFGMDADKGAGMNALVATVLDPALVTPEIREAAAGALAGVSGDTATARALHKLVNDTLDKRGWGTATAALLSREGSASYLYAALLEAAGVPHELVWSHDVSPESDPEPDPPFVENDFYGRKLLVLVQPRDGEPAWCDMDFKTLPYGQLLGQTPGAPALAVPSRRELVLPQLALADRPGVDFHMDFTVAADGSAQFAGSAELKASIGFIAKENIREVPALMRKGILTQVAAQFVPGLDVSDFTLPGLDDEDSPVSVQVKGNVPAFLDSDGAALACKLPIPQLELTKRIAGGEGERKLPYFLDEPVVQMDTLRFQLGPGLATLELPHSSKLDFLGGTYELAFDRPAPDVVTVRREIALPPFSIGPEQYTGFAAFCARVDEAERGLLRFSREAAAGAPDGAAGPGARNAADPSGAIDPSGGRR